MLNTVARNEDEATLAIERHHVNQAEPFASGPLRHRKCRDPVTTRKPSQERDQRDHEDEGCNEAEICVQADNRFKL